MNKWLLLIGLLVFPLSVHAVTLEKCIDGDTAKFNDQNKIITVRFLAIDTPEISNNDYYADIAKNFTCHHLQSAQKIELIKDEASSDTDKYQRQLRWVFVDGKLLQAMLVSNGYAKVAYLYDDYKYVDRLLNLQKQAQQKELGIWRKPNYSYYAIVSVVIMLVIILIKKIS